MKAHSGGAFLDLRGVAMAAILAFAGCGGSSEGGGGRGGTGAGGSSGRDGGAPDAAGGRDASAGDVAQVRDTPGDRAPDLAGDAAPDGGSDAPRDVAAPAPDMAAPAPDMAAPDAPPDLAPDLGPDGPACGGPCTGGALCKGGPACEACSDPADDSLCAAAYGAGSICLAGACQPGCRHDTECAAGGLCKANACGACTGATDDQACSDRYGSGNICKGGTCAPGCRVAADCSGAQAGQLCTALSCTPCTEDTPGDAACSAQYGQARVCVAGACVPGDCRDSTMCTGPNAGRVCTNHSCTACGNNAACQADPLYGAGTICHAAPGAQQGQCVSSACATPNAACPANPSVNFCCPSGGGNACVTGNCCQTSDCGLGSVCQSHQCVLCQPVSDGNYYVDPLNGVDSNGITGSSTCAWRSVSYALAQLSASNAAAVVNVRATADLSTATGETFPIGVVTALVNGGGNVRIVPQNRTIRGAGNDVPTIKVPTNGTGFVLAAPQSRLSQLTIESADVSSTAARGWYGVRVLQGSTATAAVERLTARSFQRDGIRVERAGTGAISGELTIGAGVTLSNNTQNGLRVLANGVATIDNAVPGAAPVTINDNGSWGIFVQERGRIVARGIANHPVPQSGVLGTVVVSHNTLGGVRIENCVSDPALFAAINGGPLPGAIGNGNCAATLAGLGQPGPANELDGVAVWEHDQGNFIGVSLIGGTRVKLRRSVILDGRYGVQIDNGPTVNVVNGAPPPVNWQYRAYDTSGLDLGAAGDPGLNLLQVGWGAGAPLNGGAGLRVNLDNNAGQTVSAVGNRLQDDATSGAIVDCAQTTVAVSRNYPAITTCWTGNPARGISVCGNLTGSPANVLDVSLCSIP